MIPRGYLIITNSYLFDNNVIKLLTKTDFYTILMVKDKLKKEVQNDLIKMETLSRFAQSARKDEPHNER